MNDAPHDACPPCRPRLGGGPVRFAAALATLAGAAAYGPALPAAEDEHVHTVEREVVVDAPGFVRVRIDVLPQGARLPSAARPVWPGALHVHAPDGSVVDAEVVAGPPPARVEARTRSVNPSAGGWTVTFDLGPLPIVHRRLSLDIGGRFVVDRALLEASDDLSRWRELDSSSLFQLGDAGGAQRRAIDYSPAGERFLRLHWPRAAGLPELERAHVETTGVSSFGDAPEPIVAAPVSALLSASGTQRLALAAVELPARGMRPRWFAMRPARAPTAATGYALWSGVGNRERLLASGRLAGPRGARADDAAPGSPNSRSEPALETEDGRERIERARRAFADPSGWSLALLDGTPVNESRLTLLVERRAGARGNGDDWEATLGYEPAFVLFRAATPGTYVVCDGHTGLQAAESQRDASTSLLTAHPLRDVAVASARLLPRRPPGLGEPVESRGGLPRRASFWPLEPGAARAGELVSLRLNADDLEGVEAIDTLRLVNGERLLPFSRRASVNPSPERVILKRAQDDGLTWSLDSPGGSHVMWSVELVLPADSGIQNIRLETTGEARPGVRAPTLQLGTLRREQAAPELELWHADVGALPARELRLIVGHQEDSGRLDERIADAIERDGLILWRREPEYLFLWPSVGGVELASGFDTNARPFPSFASELERSGLEPGTPVEIDLSRARTSQRLLPFDARWLLLVSLVVAGGLLLVVLRLALAPRD